MYKVSSEKVAVLQVFLKTKVKDVKEELPVYQVWNPFKQALKNT